MQQPDIVHTFGDYECRYTPTIMSGPVFRWSPAGRFSKFEVSASRDGVMVQGGSPALDTDGVFRLAELLSLAGETVRWLKNTREDIDEVKARIRQARPIQFNKGRP